MPKAKQEEMTFEKASNRIEEIINQLEEENVPLELSLELFKEGTNLLYFCDEKIKNAKQQIVEITDKE